MDLKRRYPDRVFLIIGNRYKAECGVASHRPLQHMADSWCTRDINKTKLSSELHPSDVLDRRVEDHPGVFHRQASKHMWQPESRRCLLSGPFWVPESKRVRPLDYLKQRLVDEYGKRTVGQWSPEQ